MRISRLTLATAILIPLLLSSPATAPATEAAPSVDSVLTKWEEESQKCKTLDAKLTVWHYDSVFGGDRPTITQGRFYYEAPNLGRYETQKTTKRSTNDWPCISEAIIWNGKETLWIDGGSRCCTKYSTAAIQSSLDEPEGKAASGFFGIFSDLGREIALGIYGPQNSHLLLVVVRAAEIRKQFDVTVKERGEEILMKAVPKRQADKACFREIDVILNAKTYMTAATQWVSSNGRERVIHALSDVRVNQRPSDRDQLIAPNLFGFAVTEIYPPIVHGETTNPQEKTK